MLSQDATPARRAACVACVDEDDEIVSPGFVAKQKAARRADAAVALVVSGGLHRGSTTRCGAMNWCAAYLHEGADTGEVGVFEGRNRRRKLGLQQTLKKMMASQSLQPPKFAPWCSKCCRLFHHPLCKQRHRRPNGECIVLCQYSYSKEALEAAMLVSVV